MSDSGRLHPLDTVRFRRHNPVWQELRLAFRLRRKPIRAKGEILMAKEQILILEDDLATLSLVTKQLTAAGYEVIPVAEGWQAIQACHTKQPALIISDLSMPGMDGFEFIRQLRREEFYVPIVVISALGPAQCEAALEAGANAYLRKPVDRKLLVSTVRKEIASPSPRDTAGRKHVLVVEDVPMARGYLCAVLESAGYRVTSVKSGAAATEIVEKTPPDAVVCDTNIPGLDGAELIGSLRRAGGCKAPILVVSSRMDEQHRRAMLDAGADVFVPKPVERSELLGRLEELLSGSKKDVKGAGETEPDPGHGGG
jgi:CheY-like chemotaxis protein